MENNQHNACHRLIAKSQWDQGLFVVHKIKSYTRPHCSKVNMNFNESQFTKRTIWDSTCYSFQILSYAKLKVTFIHFSGFWRFCANATFLKNKAVMAVLYYWWPFKIQSSRILASPSQFLEALTSGIIICP